MASKKGHSRVGLFGDTIHYDAHGKKIGETRPGLFGGATHYDAKGHKIGTSSPQLFGGETIYDANHKKIGSTSPGLFGTSYYDANHRKVGSSTPFLGHSTNDNNLSNQYENLYANPINDPWRYRSGAGSQSPSTNNTRYDEGDASKSHEKSGLDTFATLVGILATLGFVILLLKSCMS